MSSFAGYCGRCGKHVMHKTLLGTLHICVNEEDLYYQSILEDQQDAIRKQRLRKTLSIEKIIEQVDK